MNLSIIKRVENTVRDFVNLSIVNKEWKVNYSFNNEFTKALIISENISTLLVFNKYGTLIKEEPGD
jgi:hypothetical protein